MEEVYRHLAEEGRLFDADGVWKQGPRIGELHVPEGVRLVAGKRLQRLTEETRRILTTAAVLGRSISLRLLEERERPQRDRVDPADAGRDAVAAPAAAAARADRRGDGSRITTRGFP